MVILLRIIGQRRFAQFPARPGKVEWMGEKVFGGNLPIDFIEVVVHGILFS
jgi:hypothetical protein